MTTMTRKKPSRHRNVFVPVNDAITPRLKTVLETGDANLLPPLLAGWPREEVLLLRRDLRQYFKKGLRQLEESWRQQSQPSRVLDARHMAELGRAYNHQRTILLRVCCEIEEEIEKALAPEAA